MKLVWSPEMASQAYIDTVKACKLFNESSVAELISAMAAGWNAKLIVETWSTGGAVATSIGLAVARRYTGGRHVCIVSDNESRAEYTAAIAESGMSPPEVVVGEVEEVMGGLEGIDFMVVDCMVSDFEKGFRVAKLGQRGAVLIGKNACSSRVSPDFRWRCVLDGKSRIVRSVLLPVGKGLDIAHVGASYENSGFTGKVKRRWIRHVDQRSGEEHFIRM